MKKNEAADDIARYVKCKAKGERFSCSDIFGECRTLPGRYLFELQNQFSYQLVGRDSNDADEYEIV